MTAMKQRRSMPIMAAALFAMAAGASAAVGAWPPDLRQDVGSYKVTLGILPAGVLFVSRPEHGDLRMHGGVPSGLDQHHVLVRVTDAASGRRIDDAEISARVVSVRAEEKRLLPVSVETGAAYGNFFRLRAERDYRVELTIRRPGAPGAIETAFDYRHRL